MDELRSARSPGTIRVPNTIGDIAKFLSRLGDMRKGTLQSCSAQDLRMFMSRLTSISGDLDGTNGKAAGETAETP